MRKLMFAAAGVIALAAPIAASAQGWGGDFYNGSGYGGGYQSSFGGYPQFRDAERHIRREIRDGQSEGWLDDDQARSLSQTLRWIRMREQREFGEHGWSLPSWDAQRIQQSLDQLDRSIDTARDQDRGYDDRGGWYNER